MKCRNKNMVWMFLTLGIVSLYVDAAPIARIKESLISCPADTVILDGWASIDIGGEIDVWHWNINFDPPIDTLTLSGELKIIAPQVPRIYTITLSVINMQGAHSAPDSATLVVMDSRPRVSIGKDTVIRIGTRVQFSPHIRFNCGNGVLYEWDFNNDEIFEYSSDDNPRTTRIYRKPGRYYARFRVKDCFGKESGGVRIIEVVGSSIRERETAVSKGNDNP